MSFDTSYNMAICRHRLKLPGSNENFTSEVNQQHVLAIVYCYNCLHSRHFTDVTSAKEQLYQKTDTACH